MKIWQCYPGLLQQTWNFPNINQGLFVTGDSEFSVVKEVSDLLSSNYDCKKLERPNRSQTLREISDASPIHFVCHGVADDVDPTKSRLLLTDHVRAPLDVRALHRVDLEKCTLAYLSTCEMATSKCLALKDEQIHIAAAILIAGAPSLIGTMWRVDDELSVSMASNFSKSY